MNTVKYTTYVFTCLSYMFGLHQRSHHQAAQTHKKEIVYIKSLGEIWTLLFPFCGSVATLR